MLLILKLIVLNQKEKHTLNKNAIINKNINKKYNKF